MKSHSMFFRFAAACLLAVVTATSVLAFEGKVAMTMSTGGADTGTPMTYFLKGTHMRIEVPIPADKQHKDGSTFATIMDLDKKEMTILMADQKMYMVHAIPDAASDKAKAKVADADFKPTGRKEKIAGIQATEYVGYSDKKLTELWVTTELGQFMMADQGKGGKKGSKTSAWAKFAEESGFFALRVIQRAKEGAPEDLHLEVIAVEKGTQPDALFAPPDDYKKFEMPSMGDMMKGMIPGQ